MKQSTSLITLMTLVAGLLVATQVNAQELHIGDLAPKLDVEHWVSNGNDKFDEVNEFEDGKVYVVEFWATWCGPCIASMPHLSELQEKYAESGVQIISVSDEDLETVEDFLEGDVRGGDMTYAELTSTYCLTTDPDGETQSDYMKAAGENGIPTAFIVGKKGRIEWIGHPAEIDDPIQAVVDDKWDRETFVAERKEAKIADEIVQSIMGKLSRKMQKDDTEGALELLNEKIKEVENAKAKAYLQQIRLSILMMEGSDEAAQALVEFAESNNDNPEMLNEIAWGVVEQQMAGEEVSEALIAAGCQSSSSRSRCSPRGRLRPRYTRTPVAHARQTGKSH